MGNLCSCSKRNLIMSFGKKRFYTGDCSEVYRKKEIVNSRIFYEK